MKALINATLVSAALLAGTIANATDFNVHIVNLTNGIWYTPFLVAAHPAGTSLFTVGQPASASLQMIAEGGDISGLVADLTTMGATIAQNPAAGLLPPAMSTDVDLNTDDTSNVLLSVVAMLLPTNDAFVGLGAITIPADPGGVTGTGGSGAAMAAFDVTVANLTNAQPLSPIAVIAHRDGYSAFAVGSPSSVGLEQMAEGGDNSALLAEADTETAATIPGPAGGGGCCRP